MAVVVLAWSSAIASNIGLATCTVPVMNYSLHANYTYEQTIFGVGLFWARLGAGPLGFLVFATSVSVYFGVTASAERALAGIALPRVTGSPIAAHTFLGTILMVFVFLHVYGHLLAKVAFDKMTLEERAGVGHQFYVFFNGFVNNFWPLPYSYVVCCGVVWCGVVDWIGLDWIGLDCASLVVTHAE